MISHATEQFCFYPASFFPVDLGEGGLAGAWFAETSEEEVRSKEGPKHMTDDKQPTPTHDILTQAVVNMAVESWRFGRVFDRLLLKLDAGEHNRYKSQLRWFIKKVEEALERADMRIVNVEGHPFDPGMAATPLNIEEFDEKDALMVDQMLEPIIMGKEDLVKTGTVTLRKVEL